MLGMTLTTAMIIIIKFIIIITIFIISITVISYSDVFGPLWAPRLLNQGSMLLGPRPLMFLLARLQVGRFAFVVSLAALVLLWALRWQVGLGSELIGRVRALPGASLAWLVDAGAAGGGLGGLSRGLSGETQVQPPVPTS